MAAPIACVYSVVVIPLSRHDGTAANRALHQGNKALFREVYMFVGIRMIKPQGSSRGTSLWIELAEASQ